MLRLGTGVYGDRRGTMHIDAPAIMRKHGMAERRPHLATRWIACQALKELRVEFPTVLIVAHVQGIATQ